VLGKPREDRRALPAVPVDADADALREDAREVPEQAAAGDVRERLDVGLRAQRADLLEVQLVRREQQVGVEVVVAEPPAGSLAIGALTS